MSKYTFARASVATKLDGSQVATGIPRFETGQFGQAVMIEEGTTNLLANSNGKCTTLNAGGSTPPTVTAITPSDNPFGTQAWRVDYPVNGTAGYGGSRVITNLFAVNSGVPYTYTIWVKGDLDYVVIYPMGSFDLGTLIPTGKIINGWVEYRVSNQTCPMSGNIYFCAYLKTSTAMIKTIYVAVIQAEQKAYATSFINGTRQPETLTIPTAGVFTKGNWTVEFIFTPHNLTGYSANVLLWDCYIDASNRYGAYHDMARYLRFFATSNGIMYEIIDTSVLVVGTPYRITVSGNGSVLRLYKNGVQVGTNLAYVEPVGALPANMFIGSRWNSTGQCNGLIDDLRISNRARTGAEILAAHQSGVALPIDQHTTAKLTFDVDCSAIRLTNIPPTWIEWPLGIFILSTPTKTEKNGQIYRQVEAYDGLQVLIDDKFGTRYFVNSGVNYITQIIAILSGAGITKHNLESSTLTLPIAKEWEIGTDKLTVINDLLSEINFTQLWVDENGYYTSKKYVSPSIRSPEYTYSDDDLSVMCNGLEEELDLFNVPNKWVVVASNPESSPLVSTYTNTNPNSILSTVNRGRTIVDFRKIDNIANQATLDAYVQKIAFEASQIYGHISFETAIMPFHSYSDVIQLGYSTMSISDKYSETEWSMPLSTGAKMRHKVRKVVQI